MTKVECPGPGFKGLKWKWIQDHAKEQQEREKEKVAVDEVQPPAQLPYQTVPTLQLDSAAQTSQAPEQCAGIRPRGSGAPLQPTPAVEQPVSVRRQSGGGAGALQQGGGQVSQPPHVAKVELGHGVAPGRGPGSTIPSAALAGPAEERTRIKEEQDGKSRAQDPPVPPVPPVLHSTLGGASGGKACGTAVQSVPAVAGSTLMTAVLAGATLSAALIGAAVSLPAVVVSPTPAMPAAGFADRKSTDATPPPTAPTVSPVPTTATSPSAPTAATAVAQHGLPATALANVSAAVAPSLPAQNIVSGSASGHGVTAVAAPIPPAPPAAAPVLIPPPGPAAIVTPASTAPAAPPAPHAAPHVAPPAAPHAAPPAAPHAAPPAAPHAAPPAAPHVAPPAAPHVAPPAAPHAAPHVAPPAAPHAAPHVAPPAASPPAPPVALSAPSVAPPTSGAARVRLPPARAPSVTVAAASVKGGDDFESLFTPLSSLPVAKAETPQAFGGGASRGSGMMQGTQAAPSSAAAGGGGGAVGSGSDTGVQGGERKALPKKASRLPEGRHSSQPPASDLMDVDHGPTTARSRTPAAQVSPVAAAAGASKETAAGVVAASGPSKSQPNVQQLAGQNQAPAQQQRPSGAKHGKDNPRLREAADTLAAVGVGSGSQAAAAVAGGSGAGRGLGGDRSTGPTPGVTPGAVVHSSAGASERKRPRSDGSKPKAAPSPVGDPAAFMDFGVPYETLADRIKRAKRTATSSSDQEGPHSHGGSAERLHGPGVHAGTTAGGDGSGNAPGAGGFSGGPGGGDGPRPATSAEAQSRGADAAPAHTAHHGPHAGASGSAAAAGGGAAAGTGGASTAVAGAGGASTGAAKQQQRQQQNRGQSSGRADEACASGRGTGQAADKPPAEQQQHPHPATTNILRTSGGGAVTDSSGGGSLPPQRGSVPPSCGKGAAGQAPSGVAPGVGMKRIAEFPSSRRPHAPPAKIPRSDPQLPRPHSAHGQQERSSGNGAGTADMGATQAGNGRAAASLPPPPSGKPAHRSSSGVPPGKADGAHGAVDGQGPINGTAAAAGTVAGQGPSPTAPPPPPRPGRFGNADVPAAGSCKGPVAGSRGSKDGGGDKGACGPRNGGVDAVCGGGGAAATTTTEPKTDSDTRTSRVVECFFEVDQPCRIAGGSASISGLGSSGSLQGGHGAGGRMGGGGRFFGGGVLRGGAPAAPQHLELGKIRSFKELWAQLAALYDGTLPDEMDSKIIYLDEEGDWIMVTPDEPWSSVASAATKVLVTNRT